MPYAVIAGASQGIGRAIALGLAASGFNLLLVARRPEPLDEAVGLARDAAGAVGGSPRGDIEGLAVDLVDDGGRARLVSTVAGHAEGLDVLVLSAGITLRGDIAEASLADLDSHYAANLRVPYALAQALLPSLRRAQGQVVFVNSSAALVARANAGQYGAMQHALRGLADALRDEVNAEGIRVTSVYPGRTATPRQERIHAWEGKPYRPERLLQPSDVAAMVVAAIELPRTAEVTDISIRSMAKT